MTPHSGRLSVVRLSLTNFRNIAAATLRLDARCVVLAGHNGAGKTNCLEAVSLLAPGRGMRGAAAAEIARRGGPGGWSVAGVIESGGRAVSAGTGYGLGPQAHGRRAGRVVKIDGAAASSSAALGEIAAILWLTPAMDGLFTGPASERRRFIDRLASACNPSHRAMLARFDLAMRQRNRLLENGETRERLFEPFERQMAEAGVAIAAARVETAQGLAAVIAARRDRANGAAAFPWAVAALSGEIEEAIGHSPAVEIEDDYAERLTQLRPRDRAAGRATLGPHCSDLAVAFGDKDMPARLCSTGEQKALLIGLVLAQAELVKQARGGVAPIILLDEVAAHLDEGRREALFNEIMRLNCQAWMTGADRDSFAVLNGQAQFFTVSDGAAHCEEDRPASTTGRGERQRMRAS